MRSRHWALRSNARMVLHLAIRVFNCPSPGTASSAMRRFGGFDERGEFRGTSDGEASTWRWVDRAGYTNGSSGGATGWRSGYRVRGLGR